MLWGSAGVLRPGGRRSWRGGWRGRGGGGGRQAIERQAAAGISEAAALILVVDGQTGVTGADEEVVAWLRRTHPAKPVGSRGAPPTAMHLPCRWGSMWGTCPLYLRHRLKEGR